MMFSRYIQEAELPQDMENIDHYVGNPIFAIEANLEPLRKRIRENRKQESLQIIDDIQTSIDRVKEYIDQLKKE